MNIIEYPRILPSKLCDEITKKIEYTLDECTVFKIAKHSDEWAKTEIYLYKQLLIHLKKLKDVLFSKDLNNPLLIGLNKDMKLDAFHIVNYNSTDERTVTNYSKQLSRFNIVTFFYFLVDIKDFVAIRVNQNDQFMNIYSEKGKLVFIEENPAYRYIYHIPMGPYSVITGQIKLKNIL